MKRMAVMVLAAALVCGGLAGCKAEASSVLENQPPVQQASAPPDSSTPPLRIEETPAVEPLTGLPLREGFSAARRPVAVMIDASRVNLPQRGISEADLTYEMITEGGITRLMCVFSDYTTMPQVGPLRSARDQHVQMMIPLAALYAHIGGSTYATSMLQNFGWENKDVDGRFYGAQSLMFDESLQKKGVLAESSWFTSGELMQATLENSMLASTMPEYARRGPVFRFVPVQDAPRVLPGGDAPEVYVRFSGYANSRFVFDAATGRYNKFAFGQPQLDDNNGTQAAYENVFILFTDIKRYPDGVLAKVDFSQNGVGYYFNGGRFERVRWMKGTPEQPLRILRGDGSEQDVQVNPGKSYIAFVNIEDFPYFAIEGAEETASALPDNSPASAGEEQAVADENIP